ncbi:ChaN family lipoprotein [Stappia stellulata]|uniref:ChaN family lipoprotein n=1 Tax=Stappia stellulata TaxID=71235 RepID=UPI0004271DA3|nr:ChaN family lipoprotein [Stappia stellulata]
MVRYSTIAFLGAFCLAAFPVRAEVPAFTLEAGAEHPLAGKVWSRADGDFVAAGAVEKAVRDARYVLLGEIHDNPDHHALQAHLLGQVVSQGRRPAVVLEMVPRDRQGRIEAHLAATPDDAAGFGAAVGWSELGWPDYGIYRPILEVALGAGLPVVAGDAPRADRRVLAREGMESLGGEKIAVLALENPLGVAEDARLLDTLFDGHCGLMPRAALTPLVAVQRLRDAVLADAMIAAGTGRADGAVLIAGAGHVRKDFGVPRYLAWREAASDVVSVAFVEVREAAAMPSDYVTVGDGGGALYDYVWFTPGRGAARGDPCAELEKRFEKAREQP